MNVYCKIVPTLNKYVVCLSNVDKKKLCQKNNTQERMVGSAEQICCVPSTQNVCIHHQAGSLIIQQTTKTSTFTVSKQQQQQQQQIKKSDLPKPTAFLSIKPFFAQLGHDLRKMGLCGENSQRPTHNPFFSSSESFVILTMFQCFQCW